MWMTAWVGIAVERRARGRWMVLVCGSLLCFGAAEGVRQWYMRPLAIARSSQVLRTSPHNLAPSVGELSALEVVHLKGWHRRWIRLASAGGQEGWVAADALVPILRPSRE
jgi:hypothetical protein